MAEPRLIREHLDALAARLPAAAVEELADGLADTYDYYLHAGLEPDAAARAAIAEFGDPDTITAAFAAAAPGRRAARTLLATGPLVGAAWALLLLTARAWTWPVPTAARIVLPLCLAAAISLLICAATADGYRRARTAALGGALAVITLDAALLTTLVLTATAALWPIAAAVIASAARLTYAARALPTLLAR
jgi:hypothetical protein